ncbi:MAG TPA: ABC transporter ATP-binding protein [Thermoanaerobaculia bacterium]|jgi:subfamily B ATP-binding cassette protein MsbA|nr:ABC transporter ATP-binding protein [Thermoanaerobaculia bacterium]
MADSSNAAVPSKPSAGRVFLAFRRILELARPYRRTLACGFVLHLLAAVVSLSLPLGVRSLLDTALAHKNEPLLHALTLLLLGLFLLRFGLAYVGSIYLMITGERVVVDLRIRLFEHLQKLDVQFFRDSWIGDLTSRLSTDAASVRSAVNETLVSTTLTIFQVFAATAVMLSLNWRLALIVALAAPAATVISTAYGPKLQGIARESMDKVGRSVAFAQEILSGILVVKSFDRSSFETRRYGGFLAAVFETAKTSARLNSLFRALVNLVTAGASISLFWFGGLEVLSGRLTIGDLVAFLFYSQIVASGISQVAQQYGDLSSLVGASERAFEILSLTPSVHSRPDARILESPSGSLEFEQVAFDYGPDRPVLDRVSFALAPGETVGIVGLSGAGKTTLLQLVCRFYDPTFGRVLFDGHDLRDLNLDWLRRQVALVSQETFLFMGTLRDNIRYGRLEATDAEIEQAARAANAEEFILRMPQGYDTEIGERGLKLSGGQRQRISLARALLKNAPVLVLDEATSSVDTLSERLIQDALDRNRAGRTTLIVAHRLATVRSADRILMLENGRIVESGTHHEMIARGGRYFHLIQNQVEPMTTAVGA